MNQATGMMNARHIHATKSFKALDELIENLRWQRCMCQAPDTHAVLTLQIEQLLTAQAITSRISMKCDQIKEHNERD